MGTTIDTRGLSCPQPVLLTLQAIKKLNKGQIMVLVDTDTSKENVIRAATSQGWQLTEMQKEGIEYQLTLTRD
ncbi:MAG: preprotein translocase subunit TatB [Desulfobacca sp. 4484_104]|nr:MAG: preprotein translocase subunit TatB [Desulfobacca sp. 4484_104]RLA88804.1 MAG: preprotein translocase subunit TatB [Deltaproteobacteria bacterium]